MVWGQRHEQRDKRQKLEVLELKMLRFSEGKTRMAKIRDKIFRGPEQVE